MRLSSPVVPRGLLLQAPDRQGDPRAPLRGADLPVRLRLGGVLRLHPPRQDGRGRAALRLVPQGLRRRELLRRDPEQRRGDPDAIAPRARSTSPGGWACRWSRPATPTTSPARTPRPTTCCCASTPARRSTTRRGCGSRPQEFYVRSPEEMYAAMPGHEEALATSARIAEMVEPNYESFGLGRRYFPSFSPPERQDARGLPARALRGGPARALRRRPRPARSASGSTTSWASSTGWGSPRTS